MVRLRNCQLRNYYLTLKTKGTRDSTHAIHACTQNTLAMWELLRLKSIKQTLGFTRKYIHQYQNNLSTDLWLYLTGEQNKRNIQNTKFKSDTSDIRFLTVRMSGRVFVV